MMETEYDFFVGIDWATQSHEVAVVRREGGIVARRVVQHTGTAIVEFIDWLVTLADGNASKIAVAIETPRGALVEMLMDRGIAVYAINPKQLDRFRDRHTVAGAKDDKLDSYVLGDSLRTDLSLYSRVKMDDPLIIQIREFSRLHDDLREEMSRLTNRLREQIYRYFPQMLRLCPAADEPWFWDLVDLVPTPAKAQTARPARITQLLRKRRIRRISAEEVLAELRTRPVQVAAGTVDAATAHIQVLLPRLRLVHTQHSENEKRIRTILEQLCSAENEPGQNEEHRDAEIILSMTGIGIVVAATMLAEAPHAIAERDLEALRTNSGVAPVTRRSAKRKVVVRRYACNPRLSNAMHHAARVYSQHNPAAREKYASLRAKGQKHGHALRVISDHMLRILTAMLRTRTLYDPARARQVNKTVPEPIHNELQEKIAA